MWEAGRARWQSVAACSSLGACTAPPARVKHLDLSKDEDKQDPLVDVVVYQPQHVNAEGACCHGPSCPAALNTRAQCRGYLSPEARAFVHTYVLGHPSASTSEIQEGEWPPHN